MPAETEELDTYANAYVDLMQMSCVHVCICVCVCVCVSILAHSGALQQGSDAEISSLFLGRWGVAVLPSGSQTSYGMQGAGQ